MFVFETKNPLFIRYFGIDPFRDLKGENKGCRITCKAALLFLDLRDKYRSNGDCCSSNNLCFFFPLQHYHRAFH